MKRYIKSERDYSSGRAAQYQAKQSAKQLAAQQLESQRKAYVDSIRDKLESAVSDTIESDIFQPVLTSDAVARWLDYHKSTYSKYYDEGEYESEDHLSHGANVWVGAKPEYIQLSVDVFGIGNGNRGLEWIADIETGGNGEIHCWYVSKLPARMKRKFEDYKNIIADTIESLGFEILEAPKNNSDGFVFKFTDDTYDALTE